ncbi:hypothetical protein QQF64_003121 [Cirrhinus molitorella]|uniref:Glycine N-acyltransferase-like protein n=1 Tax=Cirrhinus molitorella TaxID=172907 RepID=A0ABR3MKR5_9TELE
MIILGTVELKQAESILKQSFPESIKVYGCVFNINRGKPHNLEVIADQWPDFTVIICKPKVQGTKDREGDFNIYSIYSKCKDSLKNFLNTPGVINKDAFTLLAGVDNRHLEAVQKFADQHGVPWKVQAVMNVLQLQDEQQLQFKESYAGLRLAPLSAAHAHLVNSTWKYGGDRNSYNSVLNYITHNPSLCVIEEGGNRARLLAAGVPTRRSWFALHVTTTQTERLRQVTGVYDGQKPTGPRTPCVLFCGG